MEVVGRPRSHSGLHGLYFKDNRVFTEEGVTWQHLYIKIKIYIVSRMISERRKSTLAYKHRVDVKQLQHL